jgi:hypothetical protein
VLLGVGRRNAVAQGHDRGIGFCRCEHRRLRFWLWWDLQVVLAMLSGPRRSARFKPLPATWTVATSARPFLVGRLKRAGGQNRTACRLTTSRLTPTSSCSALRSARGWRRRQPYHFKKYFMKTTSRDDVDGNKTAIQWHTWDKNFVMVNLR